MQPVKGLTVWKRTGEASSQSGDSSQVQEVLTVV